MEDGEATVLGLRRSKPLFFFGWEGAFLIQNSPTKDFQWALPHPHLTWGHSSAFQAYQWHVPIRAPIKSAPFPWNISKHFDGSGFPPAGFLEESLPPSSLIPTSPLYSATSTTNLRYSTSLVTGSGHGKHRARRGESHWGGGNVHQAIFLEEQVSLMGRGCIAGCWRSLIWIPQVSPVHSARFASLEGFFLEIQHPFRDVAPASTAGRLKLALWSFKGNMWNLRFLPFRHLICFCTFKCFDGLFLSFYLKLCRFQLFYRCKKKSHWKHRNDPAIF